MMKKLIIGSLLAILFVGGCYITSNYTRKACIVIQTNDGWTTFEDRSGHCWDWQIEDESFEIGERVDLKMNDNHTSDYPHDDIIRYVVRKDAE